MSVADDESVLDRVLRGVLVVAVLVGCIAILGKIGLSGCRRTDPEAASSAAEEFVRHIPDATGVECAQTDSDGDGYCSCTVFKGREEPMQIQCGCQAVCVFNCVRGCKYQPTMKLDRGAR